MRAILVDDPSRRQRQREKGREGGGGSEKGKAAFIFSRNRESAFVALGSAKRIERAETLASAFAENVARTLRARQRDAMTALIEMTLRAIT